MTQNHELINFYEAFSYGWGVVKKEWVFLLSVSLVTFLVLLPFDIIDSAWNDYSTFATIPEMILYGIFMIFYWIVNLTLIYNTTKIQLNILHNRKVDIKQLFELPTMQMVKFFVTNSIVLVMVVVGLIAFIIPGIYFGLKYGFAGTLVIDKNFSVVKAGEMSAQMMRGEMWQMFAFMLVMIICLAGICIAGFFCFIIGIIPAIFIAGWIGTFSNLFLYKKLSHKI